MGNIWKYDEIWNRTENLWWKSAWARSPHTMLSCPDGRAQICDLQVGDLKGKMCFRDELSGASIDSKWYRRISKRCSREYEHVWTCMNMYEHVWTCMNMYEHVWTCMNMYHTQFDIGRTSSQMRAAKESTVGHQLQQLGSLTSAAVESSSKRSGSQVTQARTSGSICQIGSEN